MNGQDFKRLDGTDLAASFRTLLQKTGSAAKHEMALASIRSACAWLLLLHQLPRGGRVELLKQLELESLFPTNLQRYSSTLASSLYFVYALQILNVRVYILSINTVLSIYSIIVFFENAQYSVLDYPCRFIRVRPANSQDQVLLAALLRFCSLLVSICEYNIINLSSLL